MYFLPSYCDSCRLACAANADQVFDGAVACRQCGKPSRVIGGASYGWSEAQHFDELSRAVHGAALTASDADVLLRALASIDDLVVLRRELRLLSKLIPSVALVRGALSEDSIALVQLKAMLLSILGAVASTSR